MKRRSTRNQSTEHSKRQRTETKKSDNTDTLQILEGENELFSHKYPLNYEYTFERQFSLVTNWLKLWNQNRSTNVYDEDSRDSMDDFVECFLLLGSPSYNLMGFLSEIGKKMKYETLVMDFSTERSMKSIMSRFSHSINSKHVKTEVSTDPLPPSKKESKLKPKKSNNIANFFSPQTKPLPPKVQTLKQETQGPYNKVTLQKHSLIIFDDAHLISSSSDRSFWPGVNYIIKKSRRPVILITQTDYKELVIANLECDINVCNFSLDQGQIQKRIREQVHTIAEKEGIAKGTQEVQFDPDYATFHGGPFTTRIFDFRKSLELSYEQMCHYLQWNGSHQKDDSATKPTTLEEDDLAASFKRINLKSELDHLLTKECAWITPESLENAEAYLKDEFSHKIGDELNGIKSFLDFFIQDQHFSTSDLFQYFHQYLESDFYHNPKMDANLRIIYKDLRISSLLLADHFSPSTLDQVRMDFVPSLNQIFEATRLEKENSRKRRCLTYFDKIGIFIEDYQRNVFENNLISL